jgi:hypothetical protein
MHSQLINIYIWVKRKYVISYYLEIDKTPDSYV